MRELDDRKAVDGGRQAPAKDSEAYERLRATAGSPPMPPSAPGRPTRTAPTGGV